MKRLWWLNLVRGVVALIIGILIFAWPNVATSTLANFMGIYWLVSGLMSLRWGLTTRREKELWLVAGLIGTFGGMAILLRTFLAGFIDPDLLIILFGFIALSTGLLHIFGGFRTEDLVREQSRGSVLLGVIEVALGALLIALRYLGPVAKIVAASWAFVGGITLILQSFQMRRATRVEIKRLQEPVH